MAFHRAIIHDAIGADPRKNRTIRESPGGTLTIVPVSDHAQILAVATALADQGVDRIELCGGIPMHVRSALQGAIGNRVQISAVLFGIESIVPAAAFNAAFNDGHPPREAFIILHDGDDPGADRLVHNFPPQQTTFAFVPDEASAAAAAAEFAASGFGLIELYGDFTTKGASDVIAAVNGRAPVGVGSLAVDAFKRVSNSAHLVG
ncbi:DUF6506 family protein [Ensifer sp.]|uniref:DUF6506 family protein n=1 Tax=Ensifer sp. TaxID=1872086 RepID=UPI0028A0449C|nr:DUF6506 family protein [Ensifer sp.]